MRYFRFPFPEQEVDGFSQSSSGFGLGHLNVAYMTDFSCITFWLWNMASASRVEFVHPDDVLNIVLDNDEETGGISSDEESDLDRQLENESKESR